MALFLFGMYLMGDGLKRVAGNRLEIVLYRLTSTPLKGVLLGTGVTAVIQSSSATSVMPGSQLATNMAKPDFVDHHDHFTNSTPESEWHSCLEHAEKIGLGSRDYELIKI